MLVGVGLHRLVFGIDESPDPVLYNYHALGGVDRTQVGGEEMTHFLAQRVRQAIHSVYMQITYLKTINLFDRIWTASQLIHQFVSPDPILDVSW